MQANKLFESNLRTSANSFCQDEPRQPPQKIRQDKYTKTYARISSIPLHIPQLSLTKIKKLYLSHNNITSLAGIERFECLESLNVSYNQLDNIQQLRNIRNPLKIIWLGLKMNKFLFGYQDWTIRWFLNLKKLDDIKLSNQQAKKQTWVMCENVANYSIQYFYRVQRVLQLMEDFKSKLLLNPSLRSDNIKIIHQNIPQIYIFKLSQFYQSPESVGQSNIGYRKILQTLENIIYMTLSFQIDLKCVCRPNRPKTYKQQLAQTFNFIANKILIRFAKRFNKELIRSLQKIQKSQESCHKLQLWQAFGKLHNFYSSSKGGFRYQTAMYDQKGKHIIEQNQNHYKVLINKNPEDQKLNFLPKSLIYNKPEIRISKSQLKQQQELLIYQRFPVFVYEKNYVQCLYEVFMQVSKEILQKYDQIKHLANQNQSIKNMKKDKKKEISILIQKQQCNVPQEFETSHLKKVYSQVSFGVPSSPVNKQIFSQVQVKQNRNRKVYSLHEISLIFKTLRGFKQGILNKKRQS